MAAEKITQEVSTEQTDESTKDETVEVVEQTTQVNDVTSDVTSDVTIEPVELAVVDDENEVKDDLAIEDSDVKEQPAEPEQEPEKELEPEQEAEKELEPELEKKKEKPKALLEKPVSKKLLSEKTKQEQESVDFSDEDAELDSDSPEYDIGDESEEEQEERVAKPTDKYNFATKNKDELLVAFAQLLESKPIQSLRGDVESIKVAFYKLHRAEVEVLRQKFVDKEKDGEEFIPPVDAKEQKLKDLFGEYRKRRNEFMANLDNQKEANLKIRLQIIEELKELINSTETMNVTFNAFRELQQRWRDAGAVPQANLKDLWDTYNHHVENFYSYVQINKELRDLDLKRNYEAKIALCEEAEELILDPSIVSAFHKLQKLHDRWRETGPVAREYKEAVWERFREASTRINRTHQEFFETLKKEQKRNLDLKDELCVKAEELADGIWTTRKEWNKASDKLLEIQKVWKAIGFAPKKDNTKIYERFRKVCDKFFDQKRVFFLQLKKEMDHNMQLKTELCEAVDAINESEDWGKATNELIELQKRWKEIGPVTRRHSDAIWKRFRAANDHFFNRKAEFFSSRNTEQDDNLIKKRELLAQIENADFVKGGFEMIKAFQRSWSEVGFVPYKQKNEIQDQYRKLMDTAFSLLRSSEKEQNIDRFKGKVKNMAQGGGERRVQNERDRLFNRVKQLESDIQLLENNIGFFSKSKNAEAMIQDVRDKIDRAKQEMEEDIKKIDLIDAQ